MKSIAPRTNRPVVLIGPMGVGKSTVARSLASRLDAPVLETDSMVEERAGLSVTRIFRDLGEERFRAMEAEALAEALGCDRAVIATGGGAVCSHSAWALLRESGALTVRLSAPAEILASRVTSRERPLLSGAKDEGERRERMKRLLAEREAWYGRCELHVDAGAGDAARVAAVLAERIEAAMTASVPIRLGASSYSCWIDEGLSKLGSRLSRRLRPSEAAKRCALLSDEKVAALYGAEAAASLKEAGFEVISLTFPSGESAKSLETAGALVEALVESGHQRGSPVVALGGGVTGDLAGFVASVLHRGCPLVQVPTTLLAMVDSSVGGKTGVNASAAKNVIGTFHQPLLVHAPLATLRTLNPRFYASGLGEVVKTALLEPGWSLLALLEREAMAISRRDPDVLLLVVRRCMELKARIVEADPEERGQRRLLNLGHTLGHALEVEGRFQRFLHGEAVGVGLLAAARVGAALGSVPKSLEKRLEELLRALGLPASTSSFEEPGVLDHTKKDKKCDGELIRFVVPVAGGGARIVPLSADELKTHLWSSRGGA